MPVLPHHRRSKRRFVVLIAATLVLATALTACERGRVGARCRGTGWGDDGGAWILRCSNGRWGRSLTKADYARILLAPKPATPPPINPATPAPTTPTTAATPTTTPEVPPQTTFGAIDAPIGYRDGAIMPGQYVTVGPAGQGCSWTTFDEYGDTTGGYPSFGNQMFMRVPFEDGRVRTTGPCHWEPAGGPRPLTGDGMMRVDIDLPSGWITAPGGPDCYWEANARDDGFLDSIVDNKEGPFPQAIYLQPSTATFVSEGCGTWAPVTNWSARVFLRSSDDDPMLGGAGFGYFDPSTPIELSGDLDHLVVTVDGWTIGLRPPSDRQFASLIGESYSAVAATPDATHAGFSIVGHGTTCGVTGGTMNVSPVVNANTGEVWRLGAQFEITCGGSGTLHGEISINQI